MNERPDWDQYFITLCYLVASRSTDNSTHSGAVIVNRHNAIISTGYNGPIKGIEPENVPTTRPEKYLYYEHAERNAIYNAAKHGIQLEGCKIYVNWLPCADCARAIVQSGIDEVIVHKEGYKAFKKASNEKNWNNHDEAVLLFLKNIRWWSGKLWLPTGYFRGQVFDM